MNAHRFIGLAEPCHADGCDGEATKGVWCERHRGGLRGWRSPELELQMRRPSREWPAPAEASISWRLRKYDGERR